MANPIILIRMEKWLRGTYYFFNASGIMKTSNWKEIIT